MPASKEKNVASKTSEATAVWPACNVPGSQIRVIYSTLNRPNCLASFRVARPSVLSRYPTLGAGSSRSFTVNELSTTAPCKVPATTSFPDGKSESSGSIYPKMRRQFEGRKGLVYLTKAGAKTIGIYKRFRSSGLEGSEDKMLLTFGG